mgnify:CR=1 FL=1|jgi:predicted RNase H-like HicB family nuclease
MISRQNSRTLSAERWASEENVECPSSLRYYSPMSITKYVYWQDDGLWLGYLEEFPDYMTQGESLEDLQAHLKDLHDDLTDGHIPGVRRVGELQVA